MARADWLDGRQHPVGLVFADIVGSTLLIHDRGTEVYARILDAYRARSDQLARDLGGDVVSHEGDEVFAVFPTAVAAYTFACGLFDDAGHPSLMTRIGMHVAPVRMHQDDLVGRGVPFAARVMAHAAPHELWMSDAARLALTAESPQLVSSMTWMASEDCTLPGVPDPQRLWRAK